MTPEEKAYNRTRIILMIIACVIWLSFSMLLFFTSCTKSEQIILNKQIHGETYGNYGWVVDKNNNMGTISSYKYIKSKKWKIYLKNLEK